MRKGSEKSATSLEFRNGSQSVPVNKEEVAAISYEDVAAWWLALDAEVRADGYVASRDEVQEVEAMAAIDVSEAVAQLAKSLPAPPFHDFSTKVLPFVPRAEKADMVLSHFVECRDDIVADGDIYASSRCTRRDAEPFSHEVHQWIAALPVKQARWLVTADVANIFVAWVSFSRDARLRALERALELAHEVVSAASHWPARLTLDGPGEERYSARWAYLGDWLREHGQNEHRKVEAVLVALREAIKQQEKTRRQWTVKQLREMVVFTVVGAGETMQSYDLCWAHSNVRPHRCDYTAFVPMTVIDGDEVMSVIPDTIDRCVLSATVVYHQHPGEQLEGGPERSFLPKIRAALDGECVGTRE